MSKTYTVTVNGTERTAVEAYSCGPGCEIHTYVFRGGDMIQRSGCEWTLTRKGSAFWEPKPVVEVSPF